MTTHTRQLILQETRKLLQTRGYAAFSYADLASSIGITKASVHYYFPTKELLATVLVDEFVAEITPVLARIKADNPDVCDRLRVFSQLFLLGFEDGMLPLCCALSAELAAMPASMHTRVNGLFRFEIDWIADALTDGIASGRLHPDVNPQRTAMLLLSTLEGGCLVARALNSVEPVLASFEALLQSIANPSLPATPTSVIQ